MSLTKATYSMIEGAQVNVLDFGATGDGVTDDSTAIQAAFDHVDANAIPSVYLPTVTENYLVQTPVYLEQPGVLVQGSKGPSYNRGGGKKGNILVGASATHGLDLGNASTSTTNPADMWAVSNLGFLQASGVTAKTKRGISVVRQNNGPDRGVIFSQISGVGMEAVVYVPPVVPGVTISLANMVIENSCLSNNKYGVWSAGRTYGLRFVGNQAEQNTNGLAPGTDQGSAVFGDFAGGITINDNMLEGQPNPINIQATFGAVQFESQRNYFERNDSNNSLFVYSVGTLAGVNTRNSAVIGPNYLATSAAYPSDFARITGEGSWLIQMNDPHPVTFCNWSGAVLSGSNIFPNDVGHYRLRQVNMAFKSPEIFVADGLARYDTASAWTHVKYVAGTQMDTPLGVQYVQDATTATDIPVALNAGDLVVINLMILAKDKTATTFNGQILSNTGVFLASTGPAYSDEISAGKWCLISMPFIAPSTVPSFKFKYNVAGGTVVAYLAGISAKNYGAYTNDGTAVQEVAPVAPKFN